MYADRDEDQKGTWLIAEDDNDELILKELSRKRRNVIRPLAVFVPDPKPGVFSKIFKKNDESEEIEPDDEISEVEYDESLLNDMQLYELRDLATHSHLAFNQDTTREQLIEGLLGASR